MLCRFIEQSKAARVIDDVPQDNEIHVIMQYFVHANPERDAELKLTLRLLCEHPLITTVHLLNERIYDDLDHYSKIRQFLLGTRLKFKDVFQYLREHQVRGYYVIINSDICFDETLANLRRSDLHVSKTMISQLRYEVLDMDRFATEENKASVHCPLFGPRFDSQDTWILHSNQAIPTRFEKLFNFHFGKPGCDNKMVYLMRMLGYNVVNDPAFVKTYHIHVSQDRNYTAKDLVPPPYGYLGPYGYYMPPSSLRPYDKEDFENSNHILRQYLQSTTTPFIIPCISGQSHDNNVAVFARLLRDQQLPSSEQDAVLQYFKNETVFSTASKAIAYSNSYCVAFEHCQLFAGEASPQWGQSHDLMMQWFSKKTMIWTLAFDIFHYIYCEPWTQALRGKRILLVSPFADEMCRQSANRRQHFYDDVDLFPDCEFLDCTIDENGTEWEKNERRFQGKFDIALVSCGSNSNAVCYSIYKNGHSAICVGPVLQMYFGILGKQWLVERPDVVRLFLNDAWKKQLF